MGQVLSLRGRSPSEDAGAAVARAMREAREAAGLDGAEVATRLNQTLGVAVYTAICVELWERGLERPSAVVFVEIVRMAGEAACRILASLS